MYDLLTYVVRPSYFNVQFKIQELQGSLCQSLFSF